MERNFPDDLFQRAIPIQSAAEIRASYLKNKRKQTSRAHTREEVYSRTCSRLGSKTANTGNASAGTRVMQGRRAAKKGGREHGKCIVR